MANNKNGAKIAAAVGLSAALAVAQVPAAAFGETALDGQPVASSVAEDVLNGDADSGADSQSADADAASVATSESDGDFSSAGQVEDTQSSSDQAARAADAGAGVVPNAQEPSDAIGEGEGFESAAQAILSLKDPDPISASAGSVLLPDRVLASYRDGSESDVPVRWALQGTPVDNAVANELEPGVYELAGEVDGSDFAVALDLEIVDPEPSANQGEMRSGESGVVKAANTIELDGETWSYSAEYSVPTGFNVAEVLSSSPNIVFRSDSGEVTECGLYLDDVDLSGVNGSVEGTYTVEYIIPEFLGTPFSGIEIPLTVMVSDPIDILSTYEASLAQQEPPEDGSYFNAGLPYTVDILLENGTSCPIVIDWNQDDVANLASTVDVPGTYTVRGTYRGSTTEIVATVWVQGIREVSERDVYTEPGVAPVLPVDVQVEYEDGSSAFKPVSWNAVEPSQYAERGLFQVVGTVEGTDIPAVAQVYVSDLVEIEHATCTVNIGAVPDLRSEQAILQYELGVNVVYPVWETIEPGDERLNTPGTFQVKGTVEGYEGYEFICDITVVDIVDYQDEFFYSTAPGVLTNFPYETSVTLSNGSTDTFGVVWDYTFSQFQSFGEFDIHGVIDGTDLPVVMHAKVLPVVGVTGLSSEYDTVEGVQPTTLPRFVSLVLEDGSYVSSLVNWNIPAPDVFKADSSPVEITGTASGYNGFLTTNIKVLWTQPSREELHYSTLVGLPPTFTDSVMMTMSDGTRRYLPVQWRTPDPQSYAQTGSFKVQGYVAGSDYPVTANVAVCQPAEGATFETTTAVGVIPYFPEIMSIELDNGDTYMPRWGHLTWNISDASAFDAPGTVMIDGSVAGSPATLTAEVAVEELADQQSLEFGVEYLMGSFASLKVMLPSVATVVSTTGTLITVPIVWNELDPAWETTPGSYRIEGIAAGHVATCDITVMRPLSAVVKDPVVTLAGTTPVGTTRSIDLLVDDGSGEERTIPYHMSLIDWDLSGIDLSVPGSYEIKGVNTEFDEEVPVSATLDVYAEIIGVETPSARTVPGEYPILPTSIEVTFGSSDAEGNTTTIDMTPLWDYYDPMIQYGEDKLNTTVEVSGSLNGIDYPITCNVDVVNIESVSVPSVSVAPGSGDALSLPSAAMVELSNGDWTVASVTWDSDYDASALDTPGASIEVSGSAYVNIGYGSDYNVSCVVTADQIESVPQQTQELFTAVTTEPGKQPPLPTAVPVQLADGSFANAPINWDWESVDLELLNTVGSEFDVVGTIEGMTEPQAFSLMRLFRAAPSDTITAHVTIVSPGEHSISYASPLLVTVTNSVTDIQDALGSSLDIVLSDGSYASGEVEWYTEGIDFSTPGTHIIKGTVRNVMGDSGSAVPAYAYVTVSNTDALRQPVDVQPARVVIDLSKGQVSLAELPNLLPGSVVVDYSQGSSAVLPVYWDLSELSDGDLSSPCEIRIHGTVEGVSGLTAQATISLVADSSQVEEAYPVGPVEPVQVDTYRTFAPVLPDAVLFEMSDGSEQELSVTWGKPTSDKYGVAGSFAVEGVVDNYRTTVVATVNVKPYEPVTGIEVAWEGMSDGASVIDLDAGEELQLDAKVEPADASFQNLTFESNDPEVVSVTEDGLLKAGMEPGTAQIVIFAEGYSRAITVVVAGGEVTEIPVSSVKITGDGVQGNAVSLQKGASLLLDVEIVPANATNLELKWTTSNDSVVKVGSESGLLIAVGAGTAVVTVTAGNGVSSSVTVTVPRTLQATYLQLVASGADRYPVNGTFDPKAYRFQIVNQYDDGTSETQRVSPGDVVISGIDMSKVGSYTLTATLKSNPNVFCQFSAEVWDPSSQTTQEPGGGQAPVVTPEGGTTGSGSGPADSQTGGTDSAYTPEPGASSDTSAGNSPDQGGVVDPAKDPAVSDELVVTGDPSIGVIGVAAGAGLIALVSAFIARLRMRKTK